MVYFLSLQNFTRYCLIGKISTFFRRFNLEFLKAELILEESALLLSDLRMNKNSLASLYILTQAHILRALCPRKFVTA